MKISVPGNKPVDPATLFQEVKDRFRDAVLDGLGLLDEDGNLSVVCESDDLTEEDILEVINEHVPPAPPLSEFEMQQQVQDAMILDALDQSKTIQSTMDEVVLILLEM